MLTQTSHLVHVSPQCSRGLSEHQKIYGGASISPRCPFTSVVLKQILEHAHHSSWIATSIEATAKQLSQVLRCREFTIQLERCSTLAYISQELCQLCSINISPLACNPHSPVIKDNPFRKVVAIYIAMAPGVCTCAVSALKSLFE